MVKTRPFLSILFLFAISNVFAQLDTNNGSKKDDKSKKKTIILNNAKEAKKPNSIELTGSSGFKKAHEKEIEKEKKKKLEEALNNKGVLTKAQLNDFRIKEMYGIRKIPKVDSPQGNFLTLSKSVTISFRDFGAIDGDVVTIFHNGVPFIKNIVLTRNYQSYQIFLEKGKNTIQILAENQGRLGANTAQYKLVNSDGIGISSKYWFLATGARAIFDITRN